MHGLAGIKISETALRNLITVLIVLFLVTLGTALTLQLLVSRDHHLNAHNRQSVMHLKIAASELSAILGAGLASGTSHRVPDLEDLAAVLLPHAVEAGRIFAIMDGAGRIRATAPAESGLKGMRLAEIFAPDFLAAGRDGSEEMTETTLNDGERAFVKMQSLAPYPGSLLVIHPRDAVLAAWRSDVAQIVTLFVVTLGVLVLLGAAFHWQAAKAAEADRTLSVGDRAARQGARSRPLRPVGLGHRARARSSGRSRCIDILGHRAKDDVLTFGEGRGAPSSRRSARSMRWSTRLLRGEQAVDRPGIPHAPPDRPLGVAQGALRARGGAGRGRRRISSASPSTSPQQKLADRLNQEAEIRLKDAIENISEAFVLWDADNRAGHVQFEIPAVPFAAGQRLRAAARPMRSWRAPPRSRWSASAWRWPAASSATGRPSRCSSATAAGCRSTSGAPRMAASSRSAPTSRRSRSNEETLRAFRARTDDDGARPAEGARLTPSSNRSGSPIWPTNMRAKRPGPKRPTARSRNSSPI